MVGCLHIVEGKTHKINSGFLSGWTTKRGARGVKKSHQIYEKTIKILFCVSSLWLRKKLTWGSTTYIITKSGFGIRKDYIFNMASLFQGQVDWTRRNIKIDLTRTIKMQQKYKQARNPEKRFAQWSLHRKVDGFWLQCPYQYNKCQDKWMSQWVSE